MTCHRWRAWSTHTPSGNALHLLGHSITITGSAGIAVSSQRDNAPAQAIDFKTPTDPQRPLAGERSQHGCCDCPINAVMLLHLFTAAAAEAVVNMTTKYYLLVTIACASTMVVHGCINVAAPASCGGACCKETSLVCT